MSFKVLFLSLHRPDRSPSQRFRFEQYINFLEKNGFQCDHSYLLNEKDDTSYYQKGNYFRKFFIVIKSIWKRFNEIISNNYDIVFVQRECFMLGTAFFEKKFSSKAKMIFDFDDSIWIHQTGENKSVNKHFLFLKDPGKTAKIIGRAHMIFAGNKFLANYASQFNSQVFIVPTTIDTKEYQKPNPSPFEKKSLCIGWSGSFSTIIHFEHVIPALEIIKQKYKDKVYFKVIGDGTYVNEALEIRGIPWKSSSEVLDLSELDIGLMPLPNDPWTEGKCGLKGLQYMALGIPTIMSPVGVNKEIITDGNNGFLADSIQEWVDKLSVLIENPELRTKLGEAGKSTVVTNYSVEANKNLYLKLFKQVLN